MTVDRRIELGLSLPDRGPITRQGESSTGQADSQRPPPDVRDAERFAAALARPENSTVEATPLSPFAPFALFGAPAAQTGSVVSRAQETPLADSMAEQVGRLLVSNGEDGKRAVRLDLKDDAWPGVSIAIEENEGRLQVEFVCAAESSRRRLAQALPEMAATLAERLQRDVLMRVRTDDEDDPCLTEHLGTA